MRHRPTALAAAALLTACSGAPPDGWAAVEGVGVLGVVGDEAYLCGVGGAVGASRWLAGADGALADDDGRWALDLDADGAWTLDGADGERASGSLTPFDAGGVYDAEPEGCRSGAVLHAGALTGAWCGGGTWLQVEPVNTVTGGPDRIEVQLVDDPDYTFAFQRLP